MSYEVAVLALVIQVLLVIYQVKVWRLRVIISPAFLFALVWSLGIIGCLVFEPLGFMYTPYPEYIDELNILISFTSLCFLIYTKIGYSKIQKGSTVNIDYCTKRSFQILSFIFLLAAVSDFLRLGGSFNVGGARENLAKILSGRPTWIGYLQLLSLPLSVYAGSHLVKIIKGEYYSLLFKMCLVLPLIANLIFSMNVGGRVDFVYSITQYLIGFALGIPLKQSFRQSLRYLKPLFFVAIGVILFISLVASLRSSHYQAYSQEKAYFESKGPIISALYGPIEYVFSTYAGYQLRRVDAVDKHKLGYGRYTFNGFINWTLPFSGQLGLEDFSIAKEFDIFYDNQETYDYNRELYFNTHSGYIPIIKDFGFYGAFLCILLLTYIAHYLFVLIQSRCILRYACQLFFFYLFWNYWVKMNYYGTLSSTVMIPLYGFLIVDIVRKLSRINYFK